LGFLTGSFHLGENLIISHGFRGKGLTPGDQVLAKNLRKVPRILAREGKNRFLKVPPFTF